MDKYCRICWNSQGWTKPTGEAQYLECGSSYVKKYGYGHEEWLFNYQWSLQGYNKADNRTYRYGFLQPIGKYFDKYKGTTFNIALYTFTPQRERIFVGEIKNVYVPDYKELEWANKEMLARGWIDSMEMQLAEIGINDSYLRNPDPAHLINIRFCQNDVLMYDPRILVPHNHKIRRIVRYMPLDWNDGYQALNRHYPDVPPPQDPLEDNDPTRSENERVRAAIDATVYNPRQVLIQNPLYRILCKRFGEDNVRYEQEFVDLTVRTNKGDKIYIEIKPEYSAKRSIRLALGQLLEYSHYPNQTKASKLLIIGEARATEEDCSYLAFLRKTYGLPVYYSQWDWGQNDICSIGWSVLGG